MTLIAALAPEGHPVLLGDLLISADLPKNGALPVFRPVFLPSVGLTVPPDPRASRQIVATRQKLCLITDNLAVAWSGSYCVAKRILCAMLDHFSPGPLTMEDIDAFLATCDYDDLYRSDLSLVGSYFDNETNGNFGHNAMMGDLPIFGPSFVGGSGCRSFINLCNNLGSQEAELRASDNSNSLSYALAKSVFLAGTLIGEELNSQESLAVHFFGGFYEIGFRLGLGFRKLSNVLHAYWLLDVSSRSRFELRLLLFIRTDYERDILIVRRIQVMRHEGCAPTKDDAVVIVSPVYRDVCEDEIQGKWLLDLNATHYCHLVLVRIDGKIKFLVIPEIVPNPKSILIEEEADGTQHIKVADDFLHRVVEQVVQREGL